MLISICILGFGPIGKAVYERLKLEPEFNETWRIHTIYVLDKSEYPEARQNSDWQWKINDETFDTEKCTSIGDDLEWLLESNGHDTVIDCMPYTPESKDLVFKLLNKGYWLHTPNKDFVKNEWRELLSTVKESKTKIYFNSMISSKSLRYTNVSLTNENFVEYAEIAEIYKKDTKKPEEIAEVIVKDLLEELNKRRGLKARGIGW